MKKNDKMKKENLALCEPAVPYQTLSEREAPSYVIEDFHVGLEQYRRGEVITAEELLKRLKREL